VTGYDFSTGAVKVEGLLSAIYTSSNHCFPVPTLSITMAMSRFEHDHPTHNMNSTEVEKAEDRHVEYGHTDNDVGVHTPKEHDLTTGDYLHKGTTFEKKVLRKIDWRLVPVLCKL